ncbi:MAG: S-methyl-5'-thioadenosine phosphorylase [Verrucomicrobiales bacterium]
MKPTAIGIIGGSGLYQIEQLDIQGEISVDTPFGPPSDPIIQTTFQDRPVYFLPRHGKGHRILPTEINHHANIWALKSLGVEFLISVGAVGSLQEAYAPRDILVPDQFFDRTSRHHTFFGEGIVAHVGFGQPTAPALSQILAQAAHQLGCVVHEGGTYVNIDGPAFSTRAESLFYHRQGLDVIGMTNLPEAKLAREAEIAFASLAMITDYDSWRPHEDSVTAEMILGHLLANADTAKSIVLNALLTIPLQAEWLEHRALALSIITQRALWPKATTEKLHPILHKYL